MAKGKLKCPDCSRTFSMPAHLARHRNSTHGRRRPGRPPGRGGKRGPGRPRGSRSQTAGAPASSDAARVIHEMQAYRDSLQAQRETIDASLAAIEEALSTFAGGGAPARRGPGRPPGRGRRGPGRPPGSGRRGPGRPRGSGARKGGRKAGRGRGARAGSLKEYIYRVLSSASRPMSPPEIGRAVKSAGYATKAGDLTKAVSNALPTTPRVRKIKRGLYGA